MSLLVLDPAEELLREFIFDVMYRSTQKLT